MSDYLRQLLDPQSTHEDSLFVSKVAACAILMELAASDGETAAAEVDAITRVMTTRFGIEGPAAAILRTIADNARLAGQTHEDYARFIREMWRPDDRRTVLGAIREVIWADGRLDPGEETLVWKVAAALGLPFDEVRGILAAGA
ncbi:MAG: TerB family tellurite resistance protein [Alphaproteobacteria bacterium]|nr:TerB family tellurite resistance protein [Alphaproteobacteria bacterium]